MRISHHKVETSQPISQLVLSFFSIVRVRRASKERQI